MGLDLPIRQGLTAGTFPTLLGRLSLLLLRSCCPVCGGSDGGRPVCSWCKTRLYPNEFLHWSSGPASVPGGGRVGVAITSPFVHSGAARDMVHLLKFGGRRGLGRVAARLICSRGGDLPGPGDVVVPVPLGRSRLRSRGYNQSALIAAPLAVMRGARFEDALRREDRPPQVGLSAAERRTNLLGSFSPRRAAAVGGRNVWVVDDVATTGATLDESARVLLDAGAESVKGLTLTYRRLGPGCIIEREEAPEAH